MISTDNIRELSDLEKPHGFVLIDAGLETYETTYETQKSLVERRKISNNRSGEGLDCLLFVEHLPVYTYGRKSKDLTFPVAGSAFEVERGGEATFHNPGQLVCYPILRLEGKERDLHLHLRRLEATIISVLKDFNISAERRAGSTGVWLTGQNKKIASIGVAVSGWVTYHGSALNVDNDLSGFSKINPCGFPASIMTSMKEVLKETCPSMVEVKESFLSHFSRHFNRVLAV